MGGHSTDCCRWGVIQKGFRVQENDFVCTDHKNFKLPFIDFAPTFFMAGLLFMADQYVHLQWNLSITEPTIANISAKQTAKSV